MHRLERGPAPACLQQYDGARQRWGDLETGDKRDLRAALEAMQADRCAYCEGPLWKGGHIEHFRRRANFSGLTFAWGNLFLSCGAEEHCGRHKDRPRGESYDPADLVKPDEEDPDGFFYLHSDGEIRPRLGIGDRDRERAERTIRILGLDCGPLRAARRRALRAYEEREPDILGTLMDMDEPDRSDFIAMELEATKDEPHGSVIRHYFERIR